MDADTTTMSRPPHRDRRVLVLLTLGLTAAVFAAREASHEAADGLALLYLLPVALVALEFGLRAGLVTAAGALALVGLWDATSSAHLAPLGYVSRATLFFGAAVLCARMAARLRRVARDGDRYFELGDDMICVANPAGWFTRVNGRWHDVLGWDAEDLKDRRFTDLIHPDDRERSLREVERIASGEKATRSFTNRLSARDGEWRHIEWSASYAADEGLIYAAARDVTERRRAEAARVVAEERLHAAFDDAMTGMAVVGLAGPEAGRMVDSNQALSEIFGIPREQMMGAFTFGEYAHPDDVPMLAREMRALAAGEVRMVDTEMRILRGDGKARWVKVRASILHDEDGVARYRLSQVIDIHDMKVNEERLRHMADHDPLSWLFNRRRFTADLEAELRANSVRNSRAAVLVIDLDRFKEVNDEAGHAAGDEVIKTVALGLIRRLRSGDLAGRLGGDEFGVLLRRVDPEQAVLVSHDLLRAVQHELQGLDEEVARAVTMSIGVAVVNGDGQPIADDVLARADRAMYQAKAEGGGRVALAPLSSLSTP